MRKTMVASALSLAVLGTVSFSSAYAQTVGKPASTNFFTKAGIVLADRIHTLEIDSLVYQMKQDGVTERSFVAGFTVKGAIVYNHELDAESISDVAGKDAGMQILPYTVSMTQDGRVFVSMTAFSMRNMINAANAEMGMSDSYGSGTYEGVWKVLDNLSALIYEYDKNYTVNGVEKRKLTILSADAKIDILGSSKPGTFLALTGGGDIGVHRTRVTDNGRTYVLEGSKMYDATGKTSWANGDADMALNYSLRYGLQYNQATKDGWNFDARLGFRHEWSRGKDFNPETRANYEQLVDGYNKAVVTYPGELESFNKRKVEYEKKYLNGVSISEHSYITLSNDIKPNKPEVPKELEAEHIKRSLFLMTPSLNISKSINKPGKRPVRMGIGIYGNIPLEDSVKGFHNIDLRNSNREIGGAKLFINF